MNRPVLLDTGPLIALLAARDASHERALQAVGQLQQPLVTCWPVLTEAAWLLQRLGEPPQLALSIVGSRGIEVVDLRPQDVVEVIALLARYQDLKLQLADACLLRLADRFGCDEILTFDQRDFGAALTPSGRLLQMLSLNR